MSCPHAQLRLTNCSFRSLGERPKENSMRQGNFAELMPIFVGFEGPVRLQAQEGKTRYCDFVSSCSFSMSPGPRILQKASEQGAHLLEAHRRPRAQARMTRLSCGCVQCGVVALIQSSTLGCGEVCCVGSCSRGLYFFFCSSLRTARICAAVRTCKARNRLIRSLPELSRPMRRVACRRCSRIFFTADCCASLRSRFLANPLT
jgi:hypothetical protein